MTTFNFTTGNPANLTGGATASMTDIGGSLTDIQTYINGGNIDTANLAASAKPVTLRGPYQPLGEASFMFIAGDTAGTWYSTLSAPVKTANFTSNNAPPQLITLPGTDYAVSGLTTKLRVVAGTGINGAAPGINFTFGLYPVTFSGASGSSITLTLGTVVTGSTVARSTPSANTAYQDASSDFTVPSAGVYVLGIVTSGTMAASSSAVSTVRLEYHHV